MNSSNSDFCLTWQQRRTVSQLEKAMLGHVDRKFGSGYPKFTPGAMRAAYFHTGHHSRAVGSNAAKLGQAIGLSYAEVRACRLSGFAHDSYQTFPANRGHDEKKSAEFLEAAFARAKKLPSAFKEACLLAIVGTEPLFDKDFNIVGQRANAQAYPSASAERIAKCVACGDFGDLYAPTGPMGAHLLCKELRGGKTPSMQDLAVFQSKQVTLLHNFRFAMPEAEAVLAVHRPRVIKYSEMVLNQLEDGRITTWEQLIAQDIKFARSKR